MSTIALRVEAPVVAWRVPYAVEYGETFNVPPPSTVYGMLLSMVGEERKERHQGVKLAMAMLSQPGFSTTLRSQWRFKDSTIPGRRSTKNVIPGTQEILTDVRFALWVDSTGEPGRCLTLAERLTTALETPGAITRYGGLSLGESRDMVDFVGFLNPREDVVGYPVTVDPRGDIALPVWTEFGTGGKTRWGQFHLATSPEILPLRPGENAFIVI